MEIIAFSGKAQAGKTTAANHIQTVFGGAKLSFANYLREEIVSAGFPRSLVYDKPLSPAARNLLQSWGELRREQWEDYFVDLLWDDLERFMSHSKMPNYVVIDDLRFQNEAEALRVFGEVTGAPIKLVRVTAMWDNDLTPEARNHQSELDLDGYEHFTHHIVNRRGYQDEFCKRVEGVLETDADGTYGTDHHSVTSSEGELQGSARDAERGPVADNPSQGVLFADWPDACGHARGRHSG